MNLQPPLTSRVAGLPDGNRTEALAMHGTLDHTLVHKSDPANVFVASIMRADATPDGYDCFIAKLHIDPNHPFFFEHPLDHVPGLMLIEANRQVGTAISHRFYEVSHDLAFVLNSLDVVFEHFAELRAPLLARFVIVAKAYRHDHLSALTCESQWLQFDRPVGTMNARWSFSPPALLARLRRNAAAGEVH